VFALPPFSPVFVSLVSFFFLRLFSLLVICWPFKRLDSGSIQRLRPFLAYIFHKMAVVVHWEWDDLIDLNTIRCVFVSLFLAYLFFFSFTSTA